MFRVGQKVAYIGEAPDTWRRWWLRIWHPEPGDDLVKGEVYTVSNITFDDQVELVGVNSPGDDWWLEGFMPECFRPVVERKTDISFAHEILRKATRKNKERA